MEDSIAAKHELVAVVIRLSRTDLYRILLRQFFKFPIVLGLLFPVGLMAFSENQEGQGFWLSSGFLVLLFGILPAVQIFRMRNSPGVNSDMQHIFSDSGISTVMGPVSNFADWTFATRASENMRYITVHFKRGAVVLPKDQVQESKLRQIRAIVRSNLRAKAKLFSD
ncbi:MAG: hypothetical protein IT169_05180 [Bryobacterales bacterium]|nr:hypothetical protein [Bryobacterales bacterium]